MVTKFYIIFVGKNSTYDKIEYTPIEKKNGLWCIDFNDHLSSYPYIMKIKIKLNKKEKVYIFSENYNRLTTLKRLLCSERV